MVDVISQIILILVAGLAGNQLTETIHHGEGPWQVLAKSRAWGEQLDGWLAPVGELLSCPFCLSHWTCAVCIFTLGWSQFPIPVLLVLSFAATRVSNTINDGLYRVTRMHKERSHGNQFDGDNQSRRTS